MPGTTHAPTAGLSTPYIPHPQPQYHTGRPTSTPTHSTPRTYPRQLDFSMPEFYLTFVAAHLDPHMPYTHIQSVCMYFLSTARLAPHDIWIPEDASAVHLSPRGERVLQDLTGRRREVWAAVRIQKRWRGYVVRRRMMSGTKQVPTSVKVGGKNGRVEDGPHEDAASASQAASDEYRYMEDSGGSGSDSPFRDMANPLPTPDKTDTPPSSPKHEAPEPITMVKVLDHDHGPMSAADVLPPSAERDVSPDFRIPQIEEMKQAVVMTTATPSPQPSHPSPPPSPPSAPQTTTKTFLPPQHPAAVTAAAAAAASASPASSKRHSKRAAGLRNHLDRISMAYQQILANGEGFQPGAATPTSTEIDFMKLLNSDHTFILSANIDKLSANNKFEHKQPDSYNNYNRISNGHFSDDSAMGYNHRRLSNYQDRSAAQYAEQAPRVLTWIRQALNILPTSDNSKQPQDLITFLRSGDILCQLACTLYPRTQCALLAKGPEFTVHKVIFFLELCKTVGVKNKHIFAVADLLTVETDNNYENNSDIAKKPALRIIKTIAALEKQARRQGWAGPALVIKSETDHHHHSRDMRHKSVESLAFRHKSYESLASRPKSGESLYSMYTYSRPDSLPPLPSPIPAVNTSMEHLRFNRQQQQPVSAPLEIKLPPLPSPVPAVRTSMERLYDRHASVMSSAPLISPLVISDDETDNDDLRSRPDTPNSFITASQGYSEAESAYGDDRAAALSDTDSNCTIRWEDSRRTSTPLTVITDPLTYAADFERVENGMEEEDKKVDINLTSPATPTGYESSTFGTLGGGGRNGIGSGSGGSSPSLPEHRAPSKDWTQDALAAILHTEIPDSAVQVEEKEKPDTPRAEQRGGQELAMLRGEAESSGGGGFVREEEVVDEDGSIPASTSSPRPLAHALPAAYKQPQLKISTTTTFAEEHTSHQQHQHHQQQHLHSPMYAFLNSPPPPTSPLPRSPARSSIEQMGSPRHPRFDHDNMEVNEVGERVKIQHQQQHHNHHTAIVGVAGPPPSVALPPPPQLAHQDDERDDHYYHHPPPPAVAAAAPAPLAPLPPPPPSQQQVEQQQQQKHEEGAHTPEHLNLLIPYLPTYLPTPPPSSPLPASPAMRINTQAGVNGYNRPVMSPVVTVRGAAVPRSHSPPPLSAVASDRERQESAHLRKCEKQREKSVAQLLLSEETFIHDLTIAQEFLHAHLRQRKRDARRASHTSSTSTSSSSSSSGTSSSTASPSSPATASKPGNSGSTTTTPTAHLHDDEIELYNQINTTLVQILTLHKQQLLPYLRVAAFTPTAAHLKTLSAQFLKFASAAISVYATYAVLARAVAALFQSQNSITTTATPVQMLMDHARTHFKWTAFLASDPTFVSANGTKASSSTTTRCTDDGSALGRNPADQLLDKPVRRLVPLANLVKTITHPDRAGTLAALKIERCVKGIETALMTPDHPL
ncbi:hypothetical protein DFJ77DRAFT_452108 [Powellomyces hirtus]|nr:hypothetical protein DFJ77DRAFT_452108 [Powellomyces hirtus]